MAVGYDDFPLEKVPAGSRRGFWSLALLLLGFTFFSATMWAGGKLGVAFPLVPDLLLLLLAGNLLLGGYAAVLAWISQRTGYATVLQSRAVFGRRGNLLPELILGFTQIGWYAWGSAVLALLLAKGLGLSAAWNVPLTVLFGLGFCSTAFVGYRGLDLLSRVAVPLMVVLIFASLAKAFVDVAQPGFLRPVAGLGVTPMGVGEALTLIVGTFISGGTQASNWTRFARTPAQAVWTTLLAFFVGNALMLFCGAVGASVYGQTDMAEVLAVQGFAGLGLLLLFLNIWTTQDNTIYNFSMAGCVMLNSKRRRVITLAGAALGTVLAVLGIYELLVPWLLMLGTLVPPIGGVVAAHYLAELRQHPDWTLSKDLPAFRLRGLLAYGAGVGAALLIPGVPPLWGVLGAAGAYVILGKLPLRCAAS